MGRWVLHLPLTLPDREYAVALAVALRDSLGHVPEMDFGEATVSAEDDQSRRTRIWCDARLDDGRRCELANRHDGRCR
ncbi:hypothetical protein [Micromonospora sp. NBRC 101691]|uniref:hypothetical protein n=1 Tax=Micromonospora sp. NBRC 101691 TaxID=3032198 RepID=UPI0024A187BA|nr:hypothetical protein [Micromonospora sp. NBRC 101691]GLY26261.1 hypothetical protein Misp04_59920 [Micromonospora sp. NBRC 101691]